MSTLCANCRHAKSCHAGGCGVLVVGVGFCKCTAYVPLVEVCCFGNLVGKHSVDCDGVLRPIGDVASKANPYQEDGQWER